MSLCATVREVIVARVLCDSSRGVVMRKQPQLETILDSVADGVFTINLDREITSFNRAAEHITGVKREQALGQKCFDVFHANICQGNCPMEKTLETGTSHIDLPVSILNIRGETVPISVSTAVLKDDRGETVGGVETFRDLSDIEELRRELTRQYSFGDIISKNHEIVKLFGVLPDIARSSSTVLIEGPSGTGKELFARAIHSCSERSDGPVRGGQLRCAAAGPAGKRAVRLLPGSFYRCQNG